MLPELVFVTTPFVHSGPYCGSSGDIWRLQTPMKGYVYDFLSQSSDQQVYYLSTMYNKITLSCEIVFYLYVNKDDIDTSTYPCCIDRTKQF